MDSISVGAGSVIEELALLINATFSGKWGHAEMSGAGLGGQGGVGSDGPSAKKALTGGVKCLSISVPVIGRSVVGGPI
jgi:hypothetical protein